MKAKITDEELAALRQRHLSTEDARRVLAACEASRLSQTGFCRARAASAAAEAVAPAAE